MSYTTPNNRTPNTAFQTRVMSRMDNKETPTAYPNAFQQKKREYEPRNTQGGYQSWKRKEDVPAKPKEISISSTEDFPSLGGANIIVKPTITQTTSLADRLKVVIQQEQEEATHRRYQKDTERKEESYHSIALSSHWQRKQQEKKEAYEAKQREIEEEERRYRWNVDPNPYPDEDDEHEPDMNNDEEDETCYNHDVDN